MATVEEGHIEAQVVAKKVMGDNASSSRLFFGLHLEKLEALGKFVQLSQVIRTPLCKFSTPLLNPGSAPEINSNLLTKQYRVIS